MLSKGKVSNLHFQRALEKYGRRRSNACKAAEACRTWPGHAPGIENFSIYIVTVLERSGGDSLSLKEIKNILLTSVPGPLRHRLVVGTRGSNNLLTNFLKNKAPCAV